MDLFSTIILLMLYMMNSFPLQSHNGKTSTSLELKNIGKVESGKQPERLLTVAPIIAW